GLGSFVGHRRLRAPTVVRSAEAVAIAVFHIAQQIRALDLTVVETVECPRHILRAFDQIISGGGISGISVLTVGEGITERVGAPGGPARGDGGLHGIDYPLDLVPYSTGFRRGAPAGGFVVIDILSLAVGVHSSRWAR